MPAVFAADIRLIIWDLDETLWDEPRGAGGIQQRKTHHDPLVTLGRHRIISFICSTNAFARPKGMPTEKVLWDYFVLPSIDRWAKGPCIHDRASQLGPRAPADIVLVPANDRGLAQFADRLKPPKAFYPQITSILRRILIDFENILSLEPAAHIQGSKDVSPINQCGWDVSHWMYPSGQPQLQKRW
ncbi:MAG: hypothetical protein AAF755_01270 [Pseudomonadota bacterium]